MIHDIFHFEKKRVSKLVIEMQIGFNQVCTQESCQTIILSQDNGLTDKKSLFKEDHDDQQQGLRRGSRAPGMVAQQLGT